MHSVRQIRPMLYVVLGLSLSGYAISIESLGHLVLGLSLLGLHTIVKRAHPAFAIPRYLASLLAVTSGAWACVGLLNGSMNALMAISQWLFMLVLITLWSRDDNRAFAQTLVMSLVLMVAGAINSASLIYGVLLIVYLIVSLYACLLFHLKVETESACRSYQLDPDAVDTTMTPQGRSIFRQSMRRLTTLICAIAIVFGLLVFLFFPRSAAPAMMFKMSAASSAPMTGFSERVGFEQVARITQNTEVVAHVTLTEHGKPMPPREIYLRGMTLDIYTGRSLRRPSFSWQWIRSDSVWESGLSQRARAGVITPIAAEQPRRIHQHISLLPTGSATLFALDGVYAISPEREMDVHYFPSDGTIRANDASNTTLNYDVISSGTPPPPEDPAAAESHRQYRDYYRGWSGRMLLASRIDDRIKEYAMRPEVSGQDEQGPLAQRRGSAPGPQPLDEEIADSIARYLQRNFSYTLDLTDVARDPDTDPIAAFLYDFKRGHCEYFAGSMALMCQSLGMKSRVVIGFRAGPEDFNSLGGYYVIRQSHAHAWTEVLTSSGWKSYDPTAATYFARPKSRRVFATLSDIFDLLQYKWASAVVTYNNEDRKTVWAQVESGVGRSFSSGKGILSAASDFLQSSTAYELSTTLIGLALAILVLILMIAVGVYIAEKRRLYRRAQRIGLSSLPTAEQLRLARQLGFYDEMLRLLVRHQIVRSPSMTPREFATSLSFLAPEAHEQVCRVTDLFYRVRYGGHRITSEQRRRLYQVISEIALSMPTGKTNHRLTVSSAA